MVNLATSNEVLLGIDVGSSGCKVVAIDAAGAIVAEASHPYPTHYPRPGWAEQDATDWYEASVAAARACVLALGGASVAAIAVDGPAHNVVILGALDEPLAPVIHWSDLRSASQADRLETEIGRRVFEVTYQRVNPLWTLPQLLWVREHRPSVLDGAHKILVTKDYVRYRLVGDYATDPYDAVGTQLFAAGDLRWSEELCDRIGLSTHAMPTVRAPAEVAGGLLPQAAADIGLTAGIPVVTGSGDTVIEAMAVGVTEPGDALVKLASSGIVIAVADRPLPSREIQTYPHVIPDRWIGLAGTNSGAGIVRWFADVFLSGRNAGVDAINEMAAGVSPGAEGLLLLPYLSGARSPLWNPHVRGQFSRVTPRHTVDHFARATLEGVAFSVRHAAEALDSAGYRREELRLIGGGVRGDAWAQIVVDVFGTPARRHNVDAPAYGSALLAGIGIGWFSWDSLPALSEASSRRFEPSPTASDTYNRVFAEYKRMAETATELATELADLSGGPDAS